MAAKAKGSGAAISGNKPAKIFAKGGKVKGSGAAVKGVKAAKMC